MDNQEEQPLLSICVPTNDRVDLLMRTLKSVMTGSPEVEIIITDNSEDDTTQKAVEELFEGYTGPWSYRKNNFGSEFTGPQKMVKNFNAAIHMAQGDHLFIIHDDDYMLEGAVEQLVKHLKELKGEYPIVLFSTQLVDLQCKVLKVHHFSKPGYHPPNKAAERLLADSSSMRFPSFVYRREVYERIGDWDIESYPVIDYNVWARSFSEFGVYMLPDLLSAYTIHAQAVTMTMFNVGSIRPILDLFEIPLEKGIIEAERLEQLKSQFLHQFILAGAWKFIRTGAYDEARKVMSLFAEEELRSLKVSPKWFYVRFLLSAYLRFTGLFSASR